MNSREKLTLEEIAYLKGFELQFSTILDGHYYRGVGKADAERMLEIYNRVFHSQWKPNFSCSGCMMRLVGSLGKVYREDKPRRGRPTTKARSNE